MKIFIIIPVYNRKRHTLRCLNCLRSQSYGNIQIIICDDGSIDGTSDAIEAQFPEVVLLKGDGNYWWTKATNTCLEYILKVCEKEDYILTLNDDCMVDKNYVRALLSCAREKPSTLIGSTIVDIKKHHKVVDSGLIWNKWSAKQRSNINIYGEDISKYGKYINTSMLTGRGTLIPVQVFKEIGVYNERRLPHYAADQELSLRAKRNNYNLVITSEAIVKSEINLTGQGSVYEKPSIKRFFQSFSLIKSPNSLKARYNFAKLCLPVWYFLIYFSLDLLRIIGSFIRRYIKHRLTFNVK